MLHEKDIAAARRGKLPRAHASYSKSGWGKKQKRMLYLYIVLPPSSTPFLPSDESLRILTAQVSGIRFKRIERYFDRDVLSVYGANGNLFSQRAPKDLRDEKRAFLEAVAAVASSTRNTPEMIIDACRDFCSTHQFRTIEWTGEKIVAYTDDGHRYESTRKHLGQYARPIKALHRTCAPHMPFLYRTALP